MNRVVCLLLISIAGAAQQRPTFSSDVDLVMVDVQVTEKGTGKPVEFLNSGDFEIYDEGQLRPVRELHFESAPVDFVFLLYGNGWSPVNDVNDFRRGLSEAVDELRAEDRAAVLRSESESKIDLPLTSDKQAIRQALLGFKRNPTPHFGLRNPTRLYDALKASAAIFAQPKDRSRRRVVVAITPDVERNSKTTLDVMITALLEADATLNAVVLVVQTSASTGGSGVRLPGGIGLHTNHPPANASIRPAIEATGGEAVPGDLFRERFPELIRRIRLRYLLGFYAEPATGRAFHRLEVELTPAANSQYPNALVRARRGYYREPAGTADR